MDNFDLTSYGVAEMSQQEMFEIEGGGWVRDAVDFCIGVAVGVWEALQS
jgi:hypothetical protein